MSDNHGNTPAAWTAVVVGLIGFMVGGIGLILNPVNYIVFYVGVGVAVVGVILYFVLDRVGLGSER